MSMESFTIKEIILEMKEDIAILNEKMDSMSTDHNENTAFRKKAINAIVGFTFLVLVTIGGAVLKVTGIITLK